MTSARPSEQFPKLFSPFTLSTLKLANRVVVAPMSRVSTCGDGVPTAQMSDYYRRFAEGGFGMIITEGIYPPGPAAQGYANQPALTSTATVEGWRSVTTAVHRCGGIIFAQIMHAGALSQHLQTTLGPSAVTPRGAKMPEYGGSGSYSTPQALSQSEIEDIVDGFARSAALAEEAGFDGVEVHAANGYLLDQFLTDYTNTRSDRYGGSACARARLTAEVITAVIERTQDRAPVGVRLSQAKVNDSHHKWVNAREAEDIYTTIAAAKPAYLHLAGEGRPWTQSGRAADGTALGALARRSTGLPVIVNGGLHTPELIEQTLADGEADLVSLGRPALADPAWPTRVRDGDTPDAFVADFITPSATLANTDHARARHATTKR
ncbi:NADH:flavin oxidoreductase [Mycobacterium sp. OAE908]|uniref:oxidoreductase n=1 Tax=Mycobacterium sp. OAE908 TaxID=2817899 RepID=UPI001AE7AE63